MEVFYMHERDIMRSRTKTNNKCHLLHFCCFHLYENVFEFSRATQLLNKGFDAYSYTFLLSMITIYRLKS